LRSQIPKSIAPEMWTTGGGYIYPRPPTMDKATFGFAVGVKDGMFKGHLVYYDHGPTPVFKMKSTVIDVVVNGCTTHFEGNGVNDAGLTVRFEVDAVDSKLNGDSFQIHASGPGAPFADYLAYGPVQKGNIKVHDQYCP
jgi:hypothetical protein